MARLQLPVHSYNIRSTPASPARLVNCFPEQLPPDAKTQLVLLRAPGVTPFATFEPGSIRGLHAAFGYLFVVAGTLLYKLDSAGTPTTIGVIPGTASVSMAHNVSHVVIVSQPSAYYTDGTTLSQITDTDFTSRGAKYVKFLDNYLMFTEPNTGRFFWADVGTTTDFNALSFATAEGDPDNIVGFETDRRQAVFIGDDSGEIWESGAGAAVFRRVIGGFFQLGTFNGDTVVRLDNAIYWAANDYTVRRLEGAVPVRVSNHAVEQFLSTVDVSTLRAYRYTQDGHFFYVLCSSTGCWVYDLVTREWHERKTYPNAYYEWQFSAQAHGRQYVGNAYSGVVGYFDPLAYTENGGIQRMEWTYQPVYSENRNAFHDRIEIVMETGVGLTTGQGSDPEIMLEYSDDGGITYDALPNRKIGKIGEYQHRPYWNGLGAARQRVYRAAISDPVRVTVSDTILDVRGGRI